jgi:hypothetical protein
MLESSWNSGSFLNYLLYPLAFPSSAFVSWMDFPSLEFPVLERALEHPWHLASSLNSKFSGFSVSYVTKARVGQLFLICFIQATN